MDKRKMRSILNTLIYLSDKCPYEHGICDKSECKYQAGNCFTPSCSECWTKALTKYLNSSKK